VGLSLGLIPWLGAEGSAAVTATLEVALAAAYGTIIARRSPGLLPGLRVAGPMLPAMAAAFAVGLPLALVHPVPAVAGAALAYFGVLWRLGAIPPELRDAVARRRT
jgi:hypothetical protein